MRPSKARLPEELAPLRFHYIGRKTDGCQISAVGVSSNAMITQHKLRQPARMSHVFPGSKETKYVATE